MIENCCSSLYPTQHFYIIHDNSKNVTLYAV